MASITTPTSLASFSSPHASSSKTPHVALSPVKGRENDWAVAAVQGDGIWTYDMSTLRPVTTFTVPPSTSFNTSPISFYPTPRHGAKAAGKQKAEESMQTDEEDTGARVTVVGVSKGEGVRGEQEGKTVWIWKGEEGVKSSVNLEHSLQTLLNVPNYRAPIICVHTNGHLTALDSSLQIRPIALPSTLSARIVASQIVPSGTNAMRVALVDKKGEVNVVELDLDGPRDIQGRIVKKGSMCAGLKDAEVVFADISTEGVITVNTAGKQLLTRSVKELGQDKTPCALLFGELTAAPLALPLPGRPVSLLALSDPEPTLLLVSSAANITAVLASSSIASFVPNGIATINNLSIVSCPTPGSYLVAISTFYKADGGRTAVHTIEITLPAKGVGMNVLLGTQTATSAYFSIIRPAAKSVNFDTLLSGLLAGIDDGTAQKTFESWLKGEEKTVQTLTKGGATYAMPEAQAKALLMTLFDGGLKTEEEKVEKTGKYSKEIVGTLLGKKWVHDGMYAGGVLNALIQLEDWSNVSLAVRTMQTIPSPSLVAYIRKSIQVDDGMEAPSLDAVLFDILASPVPAPDYRNALHAHLPVEDATKALEVFSRWLSQHVERRSEGLAGWAEEVKQTAGSSGDIPSLDSIIAHASCLLDSHLPLFLSHPASFEPLQSLQDSLAPLLSAQESYRRLRAPVEAVLTLSRREAKKREEREAKREVVKGHAAQGQGGHRGGKGKNIVRDEAGLPDEAVGKWRVEQFVF